ncbi:MAG: hypothetical protein H6732_05100 [Alphaproteobacteria bacterium]|nr:hypothetical protein [Alphaproteobacteria bacterium]
MSALLLVLALLGCSDDLAPLKPREVVTGDTRPASGAGDVTVLPERAVDVGTADQQGRPRKRMDIDQLAASLERVTGERWEEGSGDDTVQLFQRLAGSLGKPDYLSSTEEDLSPGLLFQKFLDDAATATCGRMVGRELEATRRHFLDGLPASGDPAADPAATDAVVRRALLAFHGRRTVEGDEAAEPWLWLVREVHAQTGSATKAWRTLCVGLVTHPDFGTY